MSAARSAEVLRQFEHTGAPDAELLARYVSTKDAGAFAELVRRHGELVLGVCRRVTGHPQDAEDAFQATFLVLAQKAASIRDGARLWSYLYGAAFRIAWRARRADRRRRAREVTVAALPDPPAPAPQAEPELVPVLDEELAALPEYYRAAIVLCDLRGATREEAAAALGVPEGTLSSRLANGRKKLAARLTKRGVTLSVAALPVALAEARAGAPVPTDLVLKTCGLVADFAVSGAVPGSLARLINKGFVVRKTLVFGILVVVAVAGAVYAAVPRDEVPPTDPPKPLVPVVQKPEAVPQPKIEPKPGDKLVGEPRLRDPRDLALSKSETPVWNATGTHLAVVGQQAVLPAERGLNDRPKTNTVVRVVGYPREKAAVRPYAALDEREAFVAFAPDGTGIVTTLREYGLISGRHELRFWVNRPDLYESLKIVKTVELGTTETHGFVPTADGKTFRTIAYHHDARAVVQIEVQEIDATTGKMVKSLLKLDYAPYVLSENGTRLAVLEKETSQVTVYDVDRGAKVSGYTFRGEKVANLPRIVDRYGSFAGENQPPASLALSPDGKQLLVARAVGETVVLNTDTGETLPPLEGTKEARLKPGTRAFSGDGRLLAALQTVYKTPTKRSPNEKMRDGFEPDGSFLTVWDTQTGKVLKTWKAANNSMRVAFNPVRPVLAVLEYNGEAKTRVGFWDFAAEADKK